MNSKLQPRPFQIVLAYWREVIVIEEQAVILPIEYLQEAA